MINQLLQNRSFDNELESYITQGSVSTNSDIAYSGEKSALLLATPMDIAEISQVVFFFFPGTPFKLSFFAKRFVNTDVKSVSNVRAEVNFINAIGTVIPPDIVITIRGRDLSEDGWNRYEGYGYAPVGSVAAQVVIRLEPPESGTSGLLVDDLELVNELVFPAHQPAPAKPGIPAFPGIPYAPAPPAQQGIPTFPGLPLQNLLNTLANLLLPGSPYANMIPPVPASQAQPGIPAFSSTPFAPPPPVQQGIPTFPGLPLQNLLNTLANLLLPGSPYANMTPPAPASAAHPEISSFPGFTFAPQPAPAPQAHVGNPAFSSSYFASPLYPGSPLSNMMFPGSPFTNMTPSPKPKQ